MSVRTSPRRTARREVAKLNRWVTSAIDGVTTGRVIYSDESVTRVQMASGAVDVCYGFEFENSWS